MNQKDYDRLLQENLRLKEENFKLWAMANECREHVAGLADAWTSKPINSKSLASHRTRYENGETLKRILEQIDESAKSRDVSFGKDYPEIKDTVYREPVSNSVAPETVRSDKKSFRVVAKSRRSGVYRIIKRVVIAAKWVFDSSRSGPENLDSRG